MSSSDTAFDCQLDYHILKKRLAPNNEVTLEGREGLIEVMLKLLT